MSDSASDQPEPSLANALGDDPIIAFDLPAFVRRGQDAEYMLQSLRERCERNRLAMLDMVRMRLRQWAKLATGPDDWTDAFRGPIAGLWAETGADPAEWSRVRGSSRRRRGAARDLVASVERFNERWRTFVARLDLVLVNETVDHYNRYYLIEKECVLGSARLAARYFTPLEFVSREAILAEHPTLPVPALAGA